jgi:hypothetical protein
MCRSRFFALSLLVPILWSRSRRVATARRSFMPFKSEDLIFGVVVGFLSFDTIALRKKAAGSRIILCGANTVPNRLDFFGNYRAEHYWLEAYPTCGSARLTERFLSQEFVSSSRLGGFLFLKHAGKPVGLGFLGVRAADVGRRFRIWVRVKHFRCFVPPSLGGGAHFPPGRCIGPRVRAGAWSALGPRHFRHFHAWKPRLGGGLSVVEWAVVPRRLGF